MRPPSIPCRSRLPDSKSPAGAWTAPAVLEGLEAAGDLVDLVLLLSCGAGLEGGGLGLDLSGPALR